LAKDYLTDYTCGTGDAVVERWRELGKFLLYRYLDGNVKDEQGNVKHPGYPASWYQKVAEATGDHLLVEKLEAERAAEEKKKLEVRRTAESLLTLLDARGVIVGDQARKKILETDNQKTLHKWLIRAATAESTDEVFDRH
jgi:hypothetical protein